MTCSGVCLRRFVAPENPPAPIIGDRTLTTAGPLHGDQVTGLMVATQACPRMKLHANEGPWPFKVRSLTLLAGDSMQKRVDFLTSGWT